MSQYIGDKKLKGTLELPLGDIKVMFKNNTDVTMKKNLFDIIVHNDKRVGDITDRVRLVLSTKFLSEMAEYGLEFYMISQVGQGMETLAHNLREEKISKAFGCAGTNDISIETLLEAEKEEK